MSQGNNNNFIKPEEIVRHEDGRIDLFNTILSRKDPNSHIPVISNNKARSGTVVTSTVTPINHSHPYHRTSLSATSTSPTSSASSSMKIDSDEIEDNRSSLGTTRGTSQDSSQNRGKPQYIGKGGGGRNFEKIFIGYVNNPQSVPTNIQYWHDDHHLILRDGYPKAKVHMLVLPRKRVDNVSSLIGQGGIDTVEKLVTRSNWLLERLKLDTPNLTFKMGFHVIPSILQLHLHVISQDFCSPSLKTKAHWNSFTTSYFISPEKVIGIIREKGSFSLTATEVEHYKSILKQPLKCNQCQYMPKSIPDLKEHLEGHFSSR